MSLDEAVAVVTGSGRGIGRAVASHLARAGAHLILVARSPGELEQVAEEIRAAGGRADSIVADLSNQDGVARAADRLAAEQVDVLINNAGTVGPLGATVDLQFEPFVTTLSLNVVAPAILSARLAPAMVERGWGRIVNLSSGVVSYPTSMESGNAYTASKAALEAHTVNFARELAGTGVTVNAYRPGMVDTSMQEQIRAQDPATIGVAFHERFTRVFREGGLLTPEHSAAVLVGHLASDDNGQVWSV